MKLLEWSLRAGERLRSLTAEKADSGEGPVPYLIMVGAIAVGAVAVAAIVVFTATGWANGIPDFTAPAGP